MFSLISLVAFFALIDQTFSQSSSSSSSGSSSSSSSLGPSSSSSTGGAFFSGTAAFQSVNQSFSPRSRSACTQDSRYFWMVGGEDGQEPLSDVWRMHLSNQSMQFVADSGQNDPVSSGGGVASLLGGSLVYFGAAAGLSINDVFASHNGVQWVRTRDSAPWASRSDFAYVTVPTTNIVVVMGGRLASGAPPSVYNTSDVWMNQDGLGVTWFRQSVNPPFGAVQGAGAVALIERTIILTGGIQLVNRTETFTSNVYLSRDLGVTWQIQSINQFPPVAYHSVVSDSTGVIFVIGGLQSINQRNQPVTFIYSSTNRGVTFSSLPITGALSSLSMAYSCACIFPINQQSINQRIIYLFGGVSSVIGNGTQSGIVKLVIDGTIEFSGSSISSVDVSGGMATQLPTLPSRSSSSLSSSSQSINQSSSTGTSINRSSSTGTSGNQSSSTGTSINQSSTSLSSSLSDLFSSSTGLDNLNQAINQSISQSIIFIIISMCILAIYS